MKTRSPASKWICGYTVDFSPTLGSMTKQWIGLRVPSQPAWRLALAGLANVPARATTASARAAARTEDVKDLRMALLLRVVCGPVAIWWASRLPSAQLA